MDQTLHFQEEQAAQPSGGAENDGLRAGNRRPSSCQRQRDKKPSNLSDEPVTLEISVYDALPKSLRGAPEELKSAIRKKQNKEVSTVFVYFLPDTWLQMLLMYGYGS